MSIGYKPLGNRVVVKQLPITKEELVINGIDVPESSIPFRKGIVCAVGIGERAPATGILQEMELSVGDKVIFLTEAAHVPLRINNEEYKLFREPQIEAIIE
jgi:co-chaperonin GroES (HSP10)